MSEWSTCGHLEQRASLGVERALEVQHVAVLLGVHVVVGEEHGQAVDVTQHRE